MNLSHFIKTHLPPTSSSQIVSSNISIIFAFKSQFYSSIYICVIICFSRVEKRNKFSRNVPITVILILSSLKNHFSPSNVKQVNMKKIHLFIVTPFLVDNTVSQTLHLVFFIFNLFKIFPYWRMFPLWRARVF